MSSEVVLFSLSLVICCVIVYVLGLLWFGDVRNRQLRSFFALGVFVTLWTLLNAVVMVVNTEYFMFLYTVRMIFVSVMPFALLWYFLNLADAVHTHSKLALAAVCAVPAIDIAALVTNPLHYRYFRDYTYPIPARGLLFWIHTACGFAAVILAFVFLVRHTMRTAKKNPAVYLTLVGTLIPYAINMSYTFGILKYKHDLTPIGFFFTIMLFAYSTFKSPMFGFKTTALVSVFSSLEDTVIIFNRAGVIVDTNGAHMEAFMGFDMEPGGTLITGFIDYLAANAGHLSTVDLLDIDAMRAEGYEGGEFVFRPGGEDVPHITFAVTCKSIMERGRISGYAITLSDVSTYYSMISRINTQNTRLIELRDQAEQASFAKTNFLSNMSHEMRTPMNAIIGMTSIARQSDDAEKKEQCLEKIEDASKHLLGVINDVLDMSKIEANKFELSCTEFRMDKFIERLGDVIAYPVSEKGHAFRISAGAGMPVSILSDEQRLMQVLTNLLSNAVKFTPAGGRIGLDISLERIEGQECTLRFEVSDNGIGISEEQQAKLFQAFSQADSGIARRYGGTGLGLAISKRIVEMMEGGIRVESEVDRGSRFIFTIKAQAGQDTQAAPAAEKREVQRDKQGIFACRRILLAEDIEINREIVIELLRPTLAGIDCAPDGRVALQMYTDASEPYDLVLMDIQMPEMDGYHAARGIRALDTGHAKTVPIIAMTANVFREDVEKCLEAGMNDHLGKPIDPDELMRKLEQYML